MNKNILLIDDESDVRRLMTRLITPHGYTIAEAANGIEGLQKLKEDDFALIILDHNMPVMDGLTFLTALRSEVKTDIPVLMMSGNPDAELRKKCFALGVFDFIAKPESTDVLLARVQNGLKIAQLLQFHQEMKAEMQLSSAILKRLAIPAEIRHEKFLLQTISESYAEIGGDISLAFGLDTDTPVFLIGDISGHGVSAALFSIFVSIAARKACRETLIPHEILTRLNRELTEYLPLSYFVSMFCCSLDHKMGVLHYANAGHPPPYVCLQTQMHQTKPLNSPILGIDPGARYTSVETPFSSGDWLLMVTDGIMDAFKDKTYSPDETVANIAYQKLTHQEIFDRIREYAGGQKGVTDDRTVMMLSVT